jgi:hypothetical protein
MHCLARLEEEEEEGALLDRPDADAVLIAMEN